MREEDKDVERLDAIERGGWAVKFVEPDRWEVHCKYSGHARPTLREALDAAIAEPPPPQWIVDEMMGRLPSN